MSLLALDQTFAGRRVPPWLRRFEAEPEEALRDLLLGGADLGHLNPADPERVLLDWIESFGARSGLLAEVDRALSAWIESAWGNPDPEELGAAVAAVAWIRAADLIGGCPGDDGLSGAARVIRERFLEEPSFLRSISEGRARDPEARAWLALAEHQQDRSLLPHWWSFCSLPPDVPWYHGDLGVYGLRRLPPETPSQAGGFPKEVPEGLARLADALARRVEDGWLDSEAARKEFTATVRLTMAAYPFPQDKWLPYWRHVLQDRRLREPLAESWIRDLSPKLDQLPEKGPTARARWIQPDPGWTNRAREIALRLEPGEPAAIDLAQKLIDEQRFYAQASGDSFFVVRSACNFAGKLREANPRKALEWVRLALDFDPWNEFAWTTTAAVNLTLVHLPEAASAAREAVRRFPNNSVAHNGLAEVLKAQGRLDDAERAYRLATSKFPNDPVAHVGLADVLKAQGRLDDAERAYRLATSKFRDNSFAHNGLADVLKAQGRLDDAERAYRLASSKFPNAPVTQTGLAGVLKAQGRLDDAERAYRLATSRFPDDPVAHAGFAEVLKAQGRLDEARHASRLAAKLRSKYQGAAVPSEIPSETVDLPVPADTAAPAQDAVQLTNLGVLLADTLLLRRWWRGLDQDLEAQAGELRKKAHAALEKLLRLESRSSLAAGEAGLLTLSEGDVEQGLDLLRAAARRFPGSARVRYALARAERLAVAARALDLTDPESSVRPWRRLARLEAQLNPVALLGEARTWLGQTDGAVREEGAKRSLGRLAYWIQEQLSRETRTRKGAEEISIWWARETRRLAFGDRQDRREEDLTHLPFYLERVQKHATELDLHEEDMVYRVARA